MRQRLFASFVGLLIGLSINYIVILRGSMEHDTPIIVRDTIREYVYTDEVDWNALYEAICWKESRNQPTAVGKTQDLGILQITPVYVRDVNRIIGEEKYTLEDRLCPEKSREMFEIYQRNYNPERDFVKAIYYHNPRAGVRYAKDIEEKYKEIVRNGKTN